MKLTYKGHTIQPTQYTPGGALHVYKASYRDFSKHYWIRDGSYVVAMSDSRRMLAIFDERKVTP